MKISEAWLREWVSPEVTTQELVDQLTMAGLEVDGVEPVAGSFTNVVVGEIVEAYQHPDADKLKVCQVNVGEEEHLQIICGAPNARQGLKVACAKIGAVLPGDFKIKKAKLRGVASFGMLCSASELKISEESDGIIELPKNSPIGTSLREFLRLDDTTIDIDLTPNRGDCLGIIGIAREVGVINRASVKALNVEAVESQIDDQLKINIESPEACPRYLGRVIRGINSKASTPLWMQEKLRRSGVRSIHPVVDVTNYVLMEYGHPMHGFDLSKISGDIHIRMAKKDEPFVLLDGNEVTLSENTLMIADSEKPLAMAGIMGGEHSGVKEETQDVFLESAFFSPLSIAGRARAYGLHTDASHRYERGVDPTLQQKAMERATQLLIDIVGGSPGPIVEAVSPEHLPHKEPISLRLARIKRLVGIEMPSEDVEEILTRLGLELTPISDGWSVQVPAHRFDINIEADLIEELVRIYGYNNLPVKRPLAEMMVKSVPEKNISLRRLRDVLINVGYQEAITYSFVESKFQNMVNPGVDSIPLLNPISNDLGVMRTSLLPGLIKATSHNLNRQHQRVRLFETGLKFEKVNGQINQIPMISGIITGNRYPEHWNMSDTKIDFYDIKGDVESLLALTSSDVYSFEVGAHDLFHPGQCANLLKDGKVIGVLGMVNPQLTKALDVNEATAMFEVQLDDILLSELPRYEDFSKFPANRRDIAVLVDEKVTAAQLVACVRAIDNQKINNIRVFDVYTGPGVEKGLKSVALGLTIRDPSHTLKETEISQIVDKVVVSLKKTFSATLRE